MRKVFSASFVAVLMTLSLAAFPAGARAASKGNLGGNLGVGLLLDGLNTGLAPEVIYHVTNNVAVRAWAPVFGDFVGLGVGGLFYGPKIQMGVLPAYLYGGAGYETLSGPKYSGWGTSVKTEGSGLVLTAGLQSDLSRSLGANIHGGLELNYALFEVTATASGPYGGGKWTSSFSDLSLGLTVIYYF